ncbi:MAG: hypothetical protein EP330_22615 [Deltaproteobacteria bacterium]|nr:MAG: hypothetical protein EP330_22615 [Deltaproteobacteria bacterium]
MSLIRALTLALLVGCGPKLGPPQVEYGAMRPLPMRATSVDPHRWYVVIDTGTHGERLFFFDTGFARTTCDDDFVDELGLDTGGLVFVRGVGGSFTATKAALPEMQAGGHRITRFACIVRDLDQTSSIKDPADIDVAGVIGADLLTRFVTEIDPEQAEVRLVPPSEHPGLHGTTVRMRRSGAAGVRFMVPATLADREGWWLLDTGARGSHVDGADYALTPTSTKEGAWVGGTGKGGGTRQDLHFHDGVTLELAGHAVDGLRLVDRPHGLLGFDLLGLNVLAHYKLVLDPGRNRVELTPISPVGPLPQATEPPKVKAK